MFQRSLNPGEEFRTIVPRNKGSVQRETEVHPSRVTLENGNIETYNENVKVYSERCERLPWKYYNVQKTAGLENC